MKKSIVVIKHDLKMADWESERKLISRLVLASKIAGVIAVVLFVSLVLKQILS